MLSHSFVEISNITLPASCMTKKQGLVTLVRWVEIEWKEIKPPFVGVDMLPITTACKVTKRKVLWDMMHLKHVNIFV